jgi:hypothetical protein
MKYESYNIVLNSVNGIGATNSNKTYYLDFNNIKPDISYEMTFSFVAKANTLTSFSIPMVYLDLGQSNTFEAKGNTGNNISKFIGVLTPNQLATSSFLNAPNTNPPVHLDKLHSYNTLNVLILNENGGAWLDANATPADIGAYVMVLHLKPVN